MTERVVGPVAPLAKPDASAGVIGGPFREPRVLRAPVTDDETVIRRPHRGGTAPLIAWLASLVVLAALVFAAYAWRDRIMAAWPPSERLYVALGLGHASGHASGSVGH